MKDEKEKRELEHLGEVLKQVSKPRLAEDSKLALKSKLMAGLDASVVGYVRRLVENINLTADRRAHIKERVFALIEKTHQKRFFWSNFFAFQKKFVGALIVVAMAFSMFTFLNVDTSVVMAETFTTLDAFSGEVFVERDGDFVDVYEGMKVFEKDRIVTGVDGEASINFFDDSRNYNN